MNLEELREKNEKDLNILTVIDQASNYNRVLVVLELKNGKYRCHRYVYHERNWKLEIDWLQANLNTVFSWLSFPTLKKSIKNCNTCLPPSPPQILRKINLQKTLDTK